MIDFYRTIVHDRMLPTHLFAVKETERMLKATIENEEGGNPLIAKRTKLKYKYV